MKMVSSSKLHRAQATLKSVQPYMQALHHIARRLLPDADGAPRTVRRAAIVVFASDSALCGAFNANAIREMQSALAAYRRQEVEPLLYGVGKKVSDYARKEGLPLVRHYEKLSGAAGYAPLAALADELAAMFERGETDCAELIYHRFKSVGTQLPAREPFLPLTPPPAVAHAAAPAVPADGYILEPDRRTLAAALVPQCLRLQLYTALLHSNASEHAVRMIAMQTATDNADELVGKLSISYNKLRQQAVTNELLDIAGGSIKP
jgi:F-type H+-transporting ATPase subunit gamma